jgi:hypothetical protein
MSPELDEASHCLDAASIAFAAGESEEAFRCIQEAAMILDNLGAALQPLEEAPQPEATLQLVLAAAA